MRHAANERQCRALATLRDTLLPLWLSGDAHVNGNGVAA
jgi:hypothetical protein